MISQYPGVNIGSEHIKHDGHACACWQHAWHVSSHHALTLTAPSQRICTLKACTIRDACHHGGHRGLPWWA